MTIHRYSPLQNQTTPSQDTELNRYLFLGGLLGWYLINGLVWWAIAGSDGLSTGFYGGDLLYGLPIAFVNGIILLVLVIARTTRLLALGILTALAVNFFISLLLNLFNNAFCFIPFFIK